jgi:hypothetical protein
MIYVEAFFVARKGVPAQGIVKYKLGVLGVI